MRHTILSIDFFLELDRALFSQSSVPKFLFYVYSILKVSLEFQKKRHKYKHSKVQKWISNNADAKLAHNHRAIINYIYVNKIIYIMISFLQVEKLGK